MRQAYLQKADIETRADKGLENEEFVVFYQPKYNVSKNCVESAEALIRWYDPEQKFYRSPGAFLPIFEANGFIVKLDHYVYEKVCRYISESIERNQFVLPISVNISRVTAVQPDFIEIYSNMKHRYHIPDDMLILEFTESFADENYERLERTISALHRNGFICSIDDFGSGYSSFNILKRIHVDELKLDAVFAAPSGNVQRDDKILSTMIDLAKSMNMVVVQEGVETENMFNKVVSMGVDVVQGYYYAKAISLEEFKIFVNSNTSIKYKSKVK
jgi:EAL domain-containing protein (putative c-di-GMP-specific phosphodiesterase class I)